jgi:kynureninase
MNNIANKAFAIEADANDPLKAFREEFFFPERNGEKLIYFCGNSLGLQTKKTRAYIEQELDDWAKHGVEGHFKAANPWYSYHDKLIPQLSDIVGAKKEEVLIMDTLTANLHFLMVSFYRPNKKRYKILCEEKSFPSDTYALESQIKFHGYDPKDALIRISPAKENQHISTEDIIQCIQENKDELALVMMGGVNYYSGQVFDMKTICKAAHEAGAIAGFDLAHAVGNIPLQLHEWNIDFACWCSYKYLNAGPGAVGGIFIHEKNYANPDLPRFSGWFGNDPASRFLMENTFRPAKGAMAWQLSNEPILSMAALRASLDIFHEAGQEKLLAKARQLSAYMFDTLQYLSVGLNEKNIPHYKILTPLRPEEHGCQISLLCNKFNGKELFTALENHGIIADWREPDVIRMAAVPLYNSFMDVYKMGEVFREFFSA